MDKSTHFFGQPKPQEMGDRAAVQTDEAELPAKVLLRRKCQCHQDTNLGDAHRQPVDDGHAKRAETSVELLRHGDNGENLADVLR